MNQTLDRRGKTGDGFTLIELLVVVIIIGILLGIALGVTRAVDEKRKISRAETEMATLSQSLEQYKSHYGDYPWISGTGSEARREGLYEALNGFRGPQTDTLNPQQRVFLQHDAFTLANEDDYDAAGNHLLDPWGQPYEYFYKVTTSSGAWQKAGFVLFSKGPSMEAKNPGSTGRPDYDDPLNLDNIYASGPN